MDPELEPQQYYPLYQEEDVPLIDVRESTLRKLVWGTILILVAFIGMGSTLRFPNEITVPFVLKSNQPETIYQFSHTVFLLEKMVSEQEAVNIGQPLVKITSPEIVEMLILLDQKEHELAYHLQQTVVAVNKEKDILMAQRRSLQVNIERQKEEQHILKNASVLDSITLTKKMEYANNQYQIYKRLYESETASEVEMTKRQQLLITATNQLALNNNNYQNQLSALYFSIKAHREQQQQLEEEKQKLVIDFENTTIALQEQIRLAKNKLTQNYGKYEITKDGLILLANRNGLVSFLFAGDKEVVPSTTLLKLSNSSTIFYALTKISPQHIGQIETGSTAILKVATFPHFEWGVLKGALSPLPLSPNEQGVFPVKIKIQEFGKLANLLHVGMEGEVAILIEERSFFGYLTKYMKAAYYDVVE